MNSNQNHEKLALQGLCLKCFYLIWNGDKEIFECDKYKIEIKGIVETCPGYMPFVEGLNLLIAKMKSEGELPEWGF